MEVGEVVDGVFGVVWVVLGLGMLLVGFFGFVLDVGGCCW